MVCAFHAIEPVTDPLGFARPRNLHETLRTSLCCGAEPRFGNNRDSEFAPNSPSHHLSWWNEDALQVLADRPDLLTKAIEVVPFSFDTLSITGWDVARPS